MYQRDACKYGNQTGPRWPFRRLYTLYKVFWSSFVISDASRQATVRNIIDCFSYNIWVVYKCGTAAVRCFCWPFSLFEFFLFFISNGQSSSSSSSSSAPFHQPSYGHIAKMILCMDQAKELPAIFRCIECGYLYVEYSNIDGGLAP